MAVKIIRALNRGFDVLQAVQSSKCTVSLHRSSFGDGAQPKPTLLRIHKTLIGRDLSWQRIADGAYVASYTFSKAGTADEETHLAEAAAPVLAGPVQARAMAFPFSRRFRDSIIWWL